MAALRMFGKWMIGIISTLVFFVIVWGIAYYFYGVTTVTSKDKSGVAVTSKVLVNDEYIGDTPLETRLGVGAFTVKIIPPEGYRTEHTSWFIMSVVRGMYIPEEVAKLNYKLMQYAPDNQMRSFEVVDTANNPIGACDGSFCEIPLPGPGNYRAVINEMCLDGGVCYHRAEHEFVLTPEQPTAEVRWN